MKLIFLLFISLTLHASELPVINDGFCLNNTASFTASDVLKKVRRYDHLVKLDDDFPAKNHLGLINIKEIDMKVSVQYGKDEPFRYWKSKDKEVKDTQEFVGFIFIPAIKATRNGDFPILKVLDRSGNLNGVDKDVLPRFTLFCRSGVSADNTTAVHKCELTPSVWDNKNQQKINITPFGLSKFTQVTKIKKGHPRCGADLRVTQSINITTNDEDITFLKKRIAKRMAPSPILASVTGLILDALFDEASFFTTYYERYLKAWKANLKESL